MKSVKKGIGEENIDVKFMGVTFKPGDYIYADSDGIIISKTELDLTKWWFSSMVILDIPKTCLTLSTNT